MQNAAEAWQSWRTTSLAKRAELFFRIRELFHAHREDLAKLLTAEHGKVLSDAMGEVARGLEVIEFACGIPTLIKGEFSEQASTGIDVYSIRQPLGVVAGHHAVQLPRDGAHVDVGARDRLRQLLHPQALGEGPVGVAPDGRAAQGGGPARRRLQRRPRRQGRGRRAARASGRRRRLVRRLDPDRAVHLRDRDEARQARPGARRREEPHDRAARCRRRHGGRRRRLGGLRLGWRALHGGLGARCRRRRRRPARRGDQGAAAEGEGRERPRARLGDGAARHPRAPRQGRVVHRVRVGAGCDARRRRPRDARRTATASSSACRCSTT